MELECLYYNDLDYKGMHRKFFNVLESLKKGDFAAAGVKKMQNGLYRAKLDYENRLLFRIGRYNAKTYLLLLEVIHNHNYSASRFMRGIHVDEQKMVAENVLPAQAEAADLSYVNPGKQEFRLLDKILSFDNDQEELFHLPPPIIIIGSAGSGKTALALEKIKALKGNVLYVSLSAFLSEHAARLYYANNFENEKQEVDFLSFNEFMQSIRVPDGIEIDFRLFERWFYLHRQHSSIKDANKLFEEFRGVITGSSIEKEYLSRQDYLELGVKQSIFLREERNAVYDLFEKYLLFLKEKGAYDINMLSHRWLSHSKARYDFAVVDEVQDITSIQLYLILSSLKNRQNFILCGDSNQVVHPNFFSWAKIKTMFYNNSLEGNVRRVLSANYRNSCRVTEISNRLLMVKNERFGSIDKESCYLIQSTSAASGEVVLLEDSAAVKQEFNRKTGRSAKFAVLVMRNEDKEAARQSFGSPLLFSVQEAKGLEYENILLYNIVSGNEKEFREITRDVSEQDVEATELRYSRATDKSDHSLEAYKFYINSLYVAITRAVRNVYIIEKNPDHRLLHLMGLRTNTGTVDIKEQSSTSEEWQQEARKLEKQGKSEQAEVIRRTILGTAEVPWKPLDQEELANLKKAAFDPDNFNKKAKDKLLDYAMIYNDVRLISELVDAGFKKALNFENERSSLMRRYYVDYASDNVKAVAARVNKYGPDFRDEYNLTPLMAAARAGAINTVSYLLSVGANPGLTDNFGKNVLQTVLFQSYFVKEFARTKLPGIYHSVASQSMNIKVNHQLVKIDRHKTEYLLLNLMIALQKEFINRRTILESNGFRASDLSEFLAAFPESLLPVYRKEKSYISSVLARNEADRQAPSNKLLFLRLDRGYYVLNPELEIFQENDWINVYDLQKFEKITREKNHELREEKLNVYRKQLEEQMVNIQDRINKRGYYEEREHGLLADLRINLFNARQEQHKLKNKTS